MVTAVVPGGTTSGSRPAPVAAAEASSTLSPTRLGASAAASVPGCSRWASSYDVSSAPSFTVAAPLPPGGSSGQGPEQVLGGGAPVDQLGDVRLRAAQGVDRRHALQRLAPGQVEDHRVPGGGGHGVGVLLQAPAAEVGTRVVGRLVHGALDCLVGQQPVDAPELDQP